MDEKLKHIGVILDGNRRYAKAKGNLPWKGHEEGAKNVSDIIDECLLLGINEVTMYVFSIENFNRPKIEVEFLMNLFKKGFSELVKNQRYLKRLKINFAGEIYLFPETVVKIIRDIEEKTKHNKDMVVNFAMGYGGREEIVNSIKQIFKSKIDVDKIDKELVTSYLYIKNDVDLIIRTSGEKRTSGFLPWQGVYAELIFVDKYWPEFTKEDLRLCIEEFWKRKRRYGQ